MAAKIWGGKTTVLPPSIFDWGAFGYPASRNPPPLPSPMKILDPPLGRRCVSGQSLGTVDTVGISPGALVLSKPRHGDCRCTAPINSTNCPVKNRDLYQPTVSDFSCTDAGGRGGGALTAW